MVLLAWAVVRVAVVAEPLPVVATVRVVEERTWPPPLLPMPTVRPNAEPTRPATATALLNAVVAMDDILF